MNRPGPAHRRRPSASAHGSPGLPRADADGPGPAVFGHPAGRGPTAGPRAPTVEETTEPPSACGGPGEERGSATILAVGVMAALVLFAGVFAAVGQAGAARHRAQGAADAAALAGAVRILLGEAAACEAASELIAAGETVLERCEVKDLEITVHVTAEPVGIPAMFGPARAVSRAGPVMAR